MRITFHNACLRFASDILGAKSRNSKDGRHFAQTRANSTSVVQRSATIAIDISEVSTDC